MHPKRSYYLVLLLAVTNVASALMAWNAYRESSRLRAATLQAENTRADLEKRLAALEKRRNELDAEVASLRARSNSEPSANAADLGPDGPPVDRPGRFNWRGRMNSLNTLLQNPEFSKLWTTQQMAALDSRFSPLFKALNLSPADLDKFKSLLVEKQSAIADVMSAARDQGLSPRDPADRGQIASLLQNAQAQADANLLQTLGPAQYAQYQNYEQTLPQRNVVTQLAQSLSYGGSPLQDSQVEQLVNILAANSPTQNQNAAGLGGYFSGMGGGVDNRSSPITDAAITQAQSVLSDAQVAALQQLQAQQEAQRQIAQMMRQANGGGTAPASTPTATGQGGHP